MDQSFQLGTTAVSTLNFDQWDIWGSLCTKVEGQSNVTHAYVIWNILQLVASKGWGAPFAHDPYCQTSDGNPPFKYHYSRLNLPCSQTESPAMNISIYYIEDHWSHRRVLAFRISLEVLANWLAESARSFQLLLVTRWKEMFAVEAEGEDSDIYYQKKHISKQF